MTEAVNSEYRPDKEPDSVGKGVAERGRRRETTIIVNGREKTITKRVLGVDDLVALAFENPPTGEFICFTITYRRGRANKPEGTLEEGDFVRVKKGMVFNVTATDKS